jgi:hypothetical protein
MPLSPRQRELVRSVEDGFERVTGVPVEYGKGLNTEDLMIGSAYGLALTYWARKRTNGTYAYLSLRRELLNPGQHTQASTSNPRGPINDVRMRVVDVRKGEVPRVDAEFDLSDPIGKPDSECLWYRFLHSRRFLINAQIAFGHVTYGATGTEVMGKLKGQNALYKTKVHGRQITAELPEDHYSVSLTLPEGHLAPPLHNRTKHVLSTAEKTLADLQGKR